MVFKPDFLCKAGKTEKAADSDLLDGKDATEFAPDNIFATVSSDGTLREGDSSHAVSSRKSETSTTGVYIIKFDRNISSGCVEIGQSIDFPSARFTETADGPRGGAGADEVIVNQLDAAGNLIDGALSVHVVCK